MKSRYATVNPSLRHRLPLYPSQFLIAMAVVSIGPLLNSMMDDLGMSLSRGGLISAGLYLGNVAAIISVNTIFSDWPVRQTLMTGAGVLGMGLLTAGAATYELWSLLGAYIIIGFGCALMNTTCWIWISAHIVDNRASAALRMILFYALGMMSVPILIGLGLDAGIPWRWVLIAEGGFAILMAFLYGILPLLDVPNRRNVGLRDIKQVFAFDPKLLSGMVIAGFAYVGAEVTLNVWLPKFQIDVFGVTDSRGGLAVTLFWVGLIAGRILILPLTRRVAASRLLLGCACVFAVLVVATALAPSQLTSLILAVGAGLGASASYALIGSYAGRFPGWQSAVASSLFILSGGVGSILLPYLMGPLAGAAGFRVALALIAVPIVIYGAASLSIHKSAKESPQ
jgi:fucose permease